MGDAVIEKLSELQALGEDIHWFCPRTAGATDDGAYFTEDLLDRLSAETPSERQSRQEKIAQAEKRQDTALDASKILAFEGSDAKPYQDQYAAELATQLTRCDICIRQFHRARRTLLHNLEQEFESDEVREFMQKFDNMNITRISTGLDNLTASLLDLPPDKRSITSAGIAGTYSLFEALYCEPFLRQQDLLQKHFDQPFRLVQTKKKLRLPVYAPAITSFLFSNDSERSEWATYIFTKVIKRNLIGSEFDYGVRPFWDAAMARVNITMLEADFLPTFWRASKTIISKLDAELVANQVRAMSTNLYTLGLEHFQIDSSHFDDLLSCYQALLKLDSRSFWDAFGNISAQAVSETILRAPVLDHMLKTVTEVEPLHLESKLDFTVQFIETILPKNLVPPARFILDMLLHKLQNDSYSRYARNVGWEKGMQCMLVSLQAMNLHIKGGPISAHLLDVISADHIDLVMQEIDGTEKKEEIAIERVEQACLDIVQNALMLDVHVLSHDRSAILKTGTPDRKETSSHPNIWKKTTHAIKPGNPALPAAILSGASALLMVEKLSSRQIQASPAVAKGWNEAHALILDCISTQFFAHLESFSPEQLIELAQDQASAYGLVAFMFNGETEIHNAALSIVKVLSGEDSRRDSLKHLVQVFTLQLFTAVNRVLSVITSKDLFGPSIVGLNICTDIFSCLCDSHDCFLRSESFSNEQAYAKAIERYWDQTWQLLGMIFDQMEKWSMQLGHDKQMMQDFCRGTMDFADYVFDQYSILASSLQAESKVKSTARDELLSRPRSKFMHICKWLRLRDDYLITKAIGLTCKILARLHEANLQIEDDSAQYIENIVTGTDKEAKVRTKLSMVQKAQLQRALEEHLGTRLDDTQSLGGYIARKKQTTLQGWMTAERSSGVSTPLQRPVSQKLKQESNDSGKSDSEVDFGKLVKPMVATERHRKLMLQQQTKKPVSVVKSAPKPPADHKSFLAKRQKEKEEADRRRAMALAKAKGTPLDSGLSGLDSLDVHKGDSVMVSSDEDEEDEDDLDADLFGPTNKATKKSRRPDVDPNGAIGLKPEQKSGPTRIHRLARSSKDMRARLAPDLTALHKTILKWDFFSDGHYPPGANEHEFHAVSNTFTDPSTYQQTFEPLLILEAWQNLVKSREENTNKPYEVKVQSRSNVDSFVEISSSISHSDNREISLQEGDIILLSKAKKPMEDADSPHCLARIYRVKRHKAHCEIVYQVVSSSPLASSLVQQAIVTGVKIQSIIPLEREFGALQGLQYYDLCTQIVRAKPSSRMQFSDRQIGAYQDVYNVNRAQSEAINAALENDGFSLIQGPPGSGKTKTIVAIVGGLLSSSLASTAPSQRIAMPKGHGNLNNGNDAPSRKLLVCAPSNAAVDELVMRLKEGITTKYGRRQEIKIVRIGRSDAINSQVVDVTMDELVSKRLGGSENDQKMRQKNAELFKEHETVSAKLRDLFKERDSGKVAGKALTDLENEIVIVRKRKNELGVRIDNARDAERSAGREAELNRKKAQQAVLDEANVICATLSGSGHDMFQSLNIEFETVIIDEAAQCVEMSSLIPLKYGCVKCIMVGDPKQLPPTVFSKEAARFAYEQSLFVRMQNNHPDKVHLLDTQYRMHPDISLFPSRTFYDGLLKDGEGMAGLRRRPWHASALLAPYRFFDVAGQHQAAPKGHSLVNLAEIDVAISLYSRLTTDFHNYEFTGRIGIITPYKSQLRALKDRFSTKFGNDIFETIEFNTTDAFQGRESEVIIFSCVRASVSGGIGFLQDIRRMNVGLTRAKSSLWVLGNADSLSRGEYWRKLVDDARARDCYTSGNLLAMLRKASASITATNDKNESMPDVEPHALHVNGSKQSKRNTAPESEAPTKTEPSPDRMEGIRYRFEDRVAHRESSKSQSGGRDATNQRPKPSEIESQDVEMVNADDANGKAIVKPLSDEDTKLLGDLTPKPENPSSDRAQSKSPNPVTNTAPPQTAPRINKRPAPSPFIPRKQSRPR